MAVAPVPPGYHTVTPYLTVKGAAEAIEFYKTAFGAEEVMRLPMPDGSIAHAELKIGDSHIMMAEENPAWGNKSPTTLGGSSGGLMIYLPDADAAFARAVAAGATVRTPVEDQFYGDRTGSVICPYGHVWTVATHVEDVAPEEIQRRMDALFAAPQAA